jgi:hypothetical protein
MLVSVFAAHDGGGEDRIRWRKASRDNERREKAKSRDERKDKPCGDEPTLRSISKVRINVISGRSAYPCHHGYQKKCEALPMPHHVLFRKFHADGEYANSQDDPSKLEGNSVHSIFVTISPAMGVEYVCAVRS